MLPYVCPTPPAFSETHLYPVLLGKIRSDLPNASDIKIAFGKLQWSNAPHII